MGNQSGPGAIGNAGKESGSIVIFGASYAKGWTETSLANMPVINKGIGGDQTQGMLNRFEQDVVRSRPRAVILWGFINDIFRSKPEANMTVDEHTYQNVLKMIERAQASGIRPILATEVTITTRGGVTDRVTAIVGQLLGKRPYQAYVNDRVRAINDRLRKLAAQRGIPLLDFETVLADDDGFRKREYAVEDGSHLTEQAYRALTAYAEPLLPKLLGAP